MKADTEILYTSEEIKEARLARGLTQRGLADALGCRQQTISEWELGMYQPKNAYQIVLRMWFANNPVKK